MKINVAEKNVIKSADFEEVGCTIDNMDVRYVASLLRENYSDPVWAAVREIIANASDACREYDRIHKNLEGTTLPKINVPTKWQTEFSVRDYGAGLTHDQVFGMYSKYGKSTKRQSNDDIGGFGIGRFAPLSYGDGFTVESFVDGNCNIYTVRVDEHDDTRITQLSSHKTDEPNGIRIVMPCKQADAPRFAKMVKRLHFFGVKFNVTGVEMPKWDDKAPVILEKGVWSIRALQNIDGKHLGYSNESENAYSWRYRVYNATHYVVMGGVPYPLDASNVSGDKAKKMLGMLSDEYSLIINLPVGSVHLHHSREALKYNDHVKGVLNQALSDCYDSVLGEMQKVIDKSANIIEAAQKYVEYRQMLGGDFSAKLLWKGKKLKDQWNVDSTWDSTKKEYPYVVEMRNFVKSEENMTGVSSSHSRTARGHYSDGEIYLYDDYADTKKHGRNLMRKVKYYLDEDGVNVVRAFILKEGDRAKFEKAMKDDHFDELRELGKVIDLSKAKEKTLPKKKVVKGALPLRGIRTMTDHRWRIRDAWRPVLKADDIPDDQTIKLYVKYERGYIRNDKGGVVSPNNFDKDGILALTDNVDEPIYGLTPTALKKLEDKDDWVEVTAKARVELLAKVAKMPKKITLGDHDLGKFDYSRGDFHKFFSQLDPQSDLGKAFEALRQLAKKHRNGKDGDTVNYTTVCRSLGESWDDLLHSITKKVSVKNEIQVFLDLTDKYMPFYHFESRYYGYHHRDKGGDRRLTKLYAFFDNLDDARLKDVVKVTNWGLKLAK
jgi:hypothetical protein